MSRICICGGPNTGKSTLAATLGGRVKHTDSLISQGEQGAISSVVRWLDEPGPWVIEGVHVIRALRQYHTEHPRAFYPPCDQLIWLTDIKQPQTKGQEIQTKGLNTVRDQIKKWLAPVLEVRD